MNVFSQSTRFRMTKISDKVKGKHSQSENHRQVLQLGSGYLRIVSVASINNKRYHQRLRVLKINE